MQQLYITEIQCTKLPQNKEGGGRSHEFRKHMLLFALDESGRRHVLSSNASPYILLAVPDQPDIPVEEVCDLLGEINEFLFFSREKLDAKEVWKKPLMPIDAVTINPHTRVDRLFHIFFKEWSNKHRLLNHLRTIGLGCGSEALQVKIYHQDVKVPDPTPTNPNNTKKIHFGVSDEELIRHITGIRSHTWCSFDSSLYNSKSANHWFKNPNVLFWPNVDWKAHLRIQPDNLARPPLKICYLSAHFLSSTATPSQPFDPDWRIERDFVNVLVTTLHDLRTDQLQEFVFQKCSQQGDQLKGDQPKPDKIRSLEEEKHFIEIPFKTMLYKEDPAVFIISSCEQNPMEYLCNRFPGIFDFISGANSTPVYVENKEANREDQFSEKGRLLSIPHVGRERIDIVPFLQKLVIVKGGNLDQYTLQDAYDHEVLINKKKWAEKKLDIDIHFNNQIHLHSSQADILVRLRKQNNVMYALSTDCAIFETQRSLSFSCDDTITSMCESGVELRTRHTFNRAYHEWARPATDSQPERFSFYVNWENLQTPFVVVRKSRAESSFPDPPDTPRLSMADVLHPDIHKPPSFRPAEKKKKKEGKKDGKSKKKKQQYTGGFVIEPDPSANFDPRTANAILDFAAEYPSAIRAFLICYRRVVLDKKWLTDPRAVIQYMPLDDHTCCAFLLSYDGVVIETITDKIMAEIAISRENLKALMKKEKDPHQKGIYDVRQNVEKVRNNGAYGFMGSDTSGMGCKAMAATICALGRLQNMCNMFYIQIPQKYWVDIDEVSLMQTFPPSPFYTPASSSSFSGLSHSSALTITAPFSLPPTPLSLIPPSLFLVSQETFSNTNNLPQTFPRPPDAVCAAQHMCIFFAKHPERVPRCGPNGWGCLVGGVSYGDTDSTFVRWQAPPELKEKREILEYICATTKKCRDFVVKLYPYPTNSEFEALKYPIILPGSKKQHGSKAYKDANLNSIPELNYKGLAFLKRDRCSFVQRIGLEIFTLLMDVAEHKPFDDKVIYDRFCSLVRTIRQKPTNHAQLQDYTISIAIEELGEYTNKKVVGYHLSSLILKERGSMPRPGSRALYVMAKLNKSNRCENAMTEQSFLQNKFVVLDVEWYLTKQLWKLMQQLLFFNEPLLMRMEQFTKRFIRELDFKNAGQNTLPFKRCKV